MTAYYKLCLAVALILLVGGSLALGNRLKTHGFAFTFQILPRVQEAK